MGLTPLCMSDSDAFGLEGIRDSDIESTSSVDEVDSNNFKASSGDDDFGSEDDLEGLARDEARVLRTFMRKVGDLPPISLSEVAMKSWQVPLYFGAKRVMFISDPGAECTLLRTSVYRSLAAEDRRPLQSVDITMNAANGSGCKVHGATILPVRLAESTGEVFMIPVVVADIKAPGLLGVPALTQLKVQLDFATGEFKCQGKTLFTHKNSQNARTHVLRTSRVVVVPALSETIIPARPRKRSRAPEATYVVEGNPWFCQETGLLVGHTLVNSGTSDDVNLLVVNASEADVTLRCGLDVAWARPVEYAFDQKLHVGRNSSAGRRSDTK